MALTDEGGNSGMVMPVGPLGGYGNNGGFGDWGSWIILFLIFGMFNGGWGGMGGFGGFNGGFGFDFPWLLSGQQGINANTNNGFRDAMLNDNITSVRDGITGISTQLCNGFAGVNASISGAQNALAQQLYTNQIADLERSYAAQTAQTAGMNNIAMNLQNCCCENRANIADLKYTVATENCADRAALSDGLRDVIASQTAQTQAILDKLCALELDGVKAQLAQAQRDNVALQNQVNIATMRESQTAQTAQILAGQNAEVDALYNRLSNCPVPSTPVYGRQPIFTCNNSGCGCGNNGFIS